ncbi:Mitochondrial GTPase, partial [Perkinsus olseni]
AHSNAKCILATSVLKKGVVKIKEFMLSEREIRFQSLGIYGLLVGLPNTGKSTTMNALKRLALLASKTRYDSRGMMAGVSRAQARVTMSPGTTELIRAYQLSHNPTLYLVDTPGVTFHKDKSNPERNLKLAAVGTFPDHIFGELYIADYILWRLNNARLFQYVSVCGLSGGPTNDIRSVCREIAFQLTNDPCRDSGAMDVLSGARTFLKFYRNGLLGRYCLDALPSEGELSRYNDLVEEAEPPGPWGPNAYPLDERAAILTSYS